MAAATTSISVDRDLVEQARNALGPDTTWTDAVHEGLRRIVRQAAHQRLLDALAGLDDEQVQTLGSARKSA